MKGPEDPMTFGFDEYAMYSDDMGMEEYALELKAKPSSRLCISWVTPLDEEQAFLQTDKIAATGNGSLCGACGGTDSGGTTRLPPLPPTSNWAGAKSVLTAVKATGRFQTLRDLIGTDAYIEPSRLELVKALGEGAFAKVQLARLLPAEGAASGTDGSGGGKGGSGARQPGRQVAVKTLRHELLEDPGQVQLFVKEVALLRKLRNRHIVEFIGCSWTRSSLDDSAKPGGLPDQLFYVQEYCGGGSLGDLVRQQMVNPFRKLYSDADALRWALQVARALQYLHESRPAVIHRDLKLDNIMLLDADVSATDAKLADFGLARLMPAAERQKRNRLTQLLSRPRQEWNADMRRSSKKLDVTLDRILTSTTSASSRRTVSSKSLALSALQSSHALTGKTGSFGYMAPEVSRAQAYNSQADVFSLGMCMYNLFCRTIPTIQILLNGTEEHLELYAAKVANGYRPPLMPHLPDSVKQAIEACWRGSPELRPTAAQLVDMLAAIQDAGEVDTSGPQQRGATSGGCCTLM
ncbi:Dual specificity kinase shkE [Chlorella sorokiniana]|uniref:Dual specificity kinase shkE n=1 Tax=Chlorella sorokiniana TaxID=3076 RepID=A0A2P6TQB9_CHLSO|nr:Dual specificity kinase shkE [Chlorella sorokiniana]|eukprot:PRW56224.1 Dual specificity kinase shkE [Chlorella sorokiniana]